MNNESVMAKRKIIEEIEVKGTSLFLDTLRRLKKSKGAVVGTAVVLTVILVSLFASYIVPFSPYRVEIKETLSPPGRKYLFGSDYLGRDIFSRVVHGTRISLQVGLVAQLISLAIGVSFGALTGYYGRWIDHIFMRLTDIFYAFPTTLFAIGIMAAFEKPSLKQIFLVLGFLGWPDIARIVRGETLSLREREYAEAARALGAGAGRIIFHHILPNCLSPVIVSTAYGIAHNIIAEAWLSFLGLGVQPPHPSWGLMLYEGQTYLTTQPWLCIFPGLAIMVTVLGFNLFGYGLRDALDPRLK